MAQPKTWFVIINPTSGNGLSKKRWPKIEAALMASGFQFEHAFTNYSNHSSLLAAEAIQKGMRNIICVGGDGTLHNTVNGIMSQNEVASHKVTVGVIPIGTGNDWVRTHHIPKDYKKAIEIIKRGRTKIQDLGKINFLNDAKNPVYFNNLAGAGFDGYVVSKVSRFKHLGGFAYLLGALIGLLSFKHFRSKIIVNKGEAVMTIEPAKTMVLLVGLCQYSGGGMQLTQSPDPFDGLLDISVVKNISKWHVIKNLSKLFNGKITQHNKVEVFKSESITIEILSDDLPIVQADGELTGKGNMSVTLIPEAFSFYC